MSASHPLVMGVLGIVQVSCGLWSLRGVRWAYIAFVLLGLLYFPMKAGFRLNPQPCELAPGLLMALHSLRKYPHIIMFAVFFLISRAQVRSKGWSSFLWPAVATITMGALVEIAQGVTGRGHCRVRDLIPDTIGAVLGMVVV